MNTTTITYRGYTIEPETDPWALKYGWKFYLGSGDDRRMFTCEVSAKDWIDETLGPDHEGGEKWGVVIKNPMNVFRFDYLADAVPFAVKHNGQLTVNFINP